MIYFFYLVNKEHIYPLKYILEGFENYMTVSTVDEAKSKLQVTVAPDFKEECLAILEDIQKTYPMTRLDEPETISQANY